MKKEKVIVYRLTPEGSYESSGEWFYPKEAKQVFIGEGFGSVCVGGMITSVDDYLYETKKGNWVRQRFGAKKNLNRHTNDYNTRMCFCELISPSQAEALQARWGYSDPLPEDCDPELEV